MSLKRILGTMLATRMGGRGRRRGMHGASSMLGGFGRRRHSGVGGKMGLAALGYMAYRAYQDHQSRSATPEQARLASAGGSGRSGGSGPEGGIAGMVQDVVNRVTGDTGSASAASPGHSTPGHGAGDAPREEDLQAEAKAAEGLSEDTALLLIRAMITAAYADGSLSVAERERIMGEIAEGRRHR